MNDDEMPGRPRRHRSCCEPSSEGLDTEVTFGLGLSPAAFLVWPPAGAALLAPVWRAGRPRLWRPIGWRFGFGLADKRGVGLSSTPSACGPMGSLIFLTLQAAAAFSTIQPGSDLNPHDPQNVAAQNACKAYRPGGNPTPAQEAAANANALKYSHCMQSHGIADFPDPNGQGTLTINVGGDIDPNATKFKSAEKSCASLDTGFNTDENN